MKKILILGMTIYLICTIYPLDAQEISSGKIAPSGKFKSAFYVSFFGPTVFIGGNFDMRLNRGTNKGAGIRAGIGGGSASAGSTSASVVTFPLGVNYLTGNRRGHFFS